MNRTPHRAHEHVPHTHILLVCTWLKDSGIVFVRAIRKSHSTSSMFRGTLLDAPFTSPFSTPFPTLAASPLTAPSLLYPSTSSTAATPQGGFFCGRLAEQSPLTASSPSSPLLPSIFCQFSAAPGRTFFGGAEEEGGSNHKATKTLERIEEQTCSVPHVKTEILGQSVDIPPRADFRAHGGAVSR